MRFDLPPFIPGLELSKIFYHEAVRPILAEVFPQLAYSVARLDYGSDVLGFDTPQSRDHGWGPKLTLFLSPEDHQAFKDLVSEVLSNRLPVQIRGYPTNFDQPFSGEGGMQPIQQGPVRHWVSVETIPFFFCNYLGIDPTGTLGEVDWLILPQQHLRTIASGAVFFDGLGQLSEVRERLLWYPHDVWLYLLANQWRRIDQEEPFMARCGDVEDELGSRIVATRQVIEVMRLCFLMERQYVPYNKWFGTAFACLECASELTSIFHRVFDSRTWREREAHLSEAYLIIMKMHNALGVTPTIEAEISYFFNRPYQVPQSARFVDALHAAIQSESVRRLPRDVGAVGQFVDSTDILSNLALGQKLRTIYD
jgi:hypothetical protein